MTVAANIREPNPEYNRGEYSRPEPGIRQRRIIATLSRNPSAANIRDPNHESTWLIDRRASCDSLGEYSRPEPAIKPWRIFATRTRNSYAENIRDPNPESSWLIGRRANCDNRRILAIRIRGAAAANIRDPNPESNSGEYSRPKPGIQRRRIFATRTLNRLG